jgi:hypothetical protein
MRLAKTCSDTLLKVIITAHPINVFPLAFLFLFMFTLAAARLSFEESRGRETHHLKQKLFDIFQVVEGVCQVFYFLGV